MTKAILGYIALIDASPLVIAKEKGLFAKYGMPDVEVAKQASWGATRDNLVLGGENNGIDGAHILTPMPYLISTGKVTQNNVPMPMYVAGAPQSRRQGDLGRAGIQGPQGRPPTPRPLKAAFAKKKADGKEVKVAMTFPGGTHDLWIRYWLAAGGIDPDKDVSTIVVPPPQMVANMKVGNMDAFCVGEPWNEQLVNQGIGFTACTTGEIWIKHPEKALGLRADWVDKNPNATKALLMAVMEAQQWCEQAENKDEMADDRRQAPVVQRAGRRHHRPAQGRHQLRQRPRREGHQAVHEVLERARLLSVQEPRHLVRHRGHPLGQVRADHRHQGAGRQGQPRGSLARCGQGLSASRQPTFRRSTSRGKETFFDGKVFDPENPVRLSQEPVDQARRSVNVHCAARAEAAHGF